MTPHLCHIRHFQNFVKIDSFLKPVLKLIVGWGEGVLKEGTSILHQFYRLKSLRRGEGGSKSRYYLGPSQTSKVESFVEMVFGYKPLTSFLKSSNLDVWLVLFVKILSRNMYTRMLEFTFPREAVIN